MTKIYKSNDKLIIYIPSDIENALNLKAGDEIDFFKYKNKLYLFAKKEDIVKIMLSNTTDTNTLQDTKQIKSNSNITDSNITDTSNNNNNNSNNNNTNTVTKEYLSVLRKLNGLSFNKRTQQSISKILNDSEKQILLEMINKKFVLLIKKNEDFVYSISKYVYPKLKENNYSTSIQSNSDVNKQNNYKPIINQNHQIPNSLNNLRTNEEQLKKDQNFIETNGYLVISNEVEAGDFSRFMEESIRHGYIIGTRAFNKKFYIALKSFVIRISEKIIGIMGSKAMTVEEIAEHLNIAPDGIRSILYIIAEKGDISEVKTDIFKVVS